MKEIFQRKGFWVILLILLLAVFVYPPFMGGSARGGYYRFWEWFFLSPRFSSGAVDLKMLLVETIIAILLAIGICLIPFHKGDKKKD